MIDIIGGADPSLLRFIIIFVAIIIAITVHEFAHAFMAHKLGDATPKLQGRLNLNPINHMDPWGSVLIVFSTLFSGIPIGWGKPVEYNPVNLKSPVKDAALISLAGPVSNIALAVLAVILMKFSGAEFYNQFLIYFVGLNISLALFNLFPVDPLDGFKIVSAIIPRKLYYQWEDTRKYGFVVLLVLIATGAIGRIIGPIGGIIMHLLYLI